nr:integrin alpha-V-like [Vanessa tameamea]
MCVLIVFSVVIVYYSLLCDGSGIFNEESRITFEPDDNFSQYFGYSVLFDSDKLIVGAPKARNRYNTTINSGQVFSCALDNLNLKKVTCHPLGVNENVEDIIYRRSTKHSDFFENDMWFGATIASVPNGKLLMCAPRWTTPYRDKHLLANGACYMISKRRGAALFPLAEMSRQAFMTHGERIEYGEYGTHLNLYAYGQAGFSIKVSKTSIIIGAPGLLQWTGGIATYKYYKESEYLSLQPTINPYYTLDVGPDDYLGYSVESGVFENNGTILYVAGAPRSKSGYGQVLVFEPSFRETDPFKIKAKVRGPQLGAYFGASLCCTDVNGDGITDLLVGAPNFVRKDGVGLHYDQGAVFVYLTEIKETDFNLIAADYVSGSGESGVRFGSTIANLGDIDGDGFNDIAIGAPWEDDGKGAVFIFRGGKEGLRPKYVQKIVVKEAQTFGISISGGYDINNDNCNDLAIGAHSSATAYVFRCTPTMHVEVYIKVPDAVNLQQGATNFSALFCVKSAESKTWPRAKMDFTANIAIDPIENRARLKGDTEYEVSIQPGNENCDEQVIEVKPTADLSKPISMKFNLEVKDSEDGSDESYEQFAKVSDDSVLDTLFRIQLMRDCGDDEELICKPFLVMNLNPLSSPYIPGTKDKLGVKLSVVNMEEPSFGAKVHLTLPSSPKRLPRECSLEEFNVTCDIPSPLNRFEIVEWEIELEYAYKDTTAKELKIVANLNDPFNNDTDIDRISKEMVILITPKANFSISGKALPNATIAVTRDKFNEAANVTFVHYFEVTNFGPSDWFRLPVQITLPDKVNLSSRIKGCAQDESHCEWNIPAKVSMPVLLSLRFNLADYGDFLEQQKNFNITTFMIIQLEGQNKSSSITTTLILEPAPPLWPIILGCFAGLLLLSLIVLGLYKYGFFSRNRLEDFKRLQEQKTTLDEGNTSTNEGSSSTPEASSQELISDDSD